MLPNSRATPGSQAPSPGNTNAEQLDLTTNFTELNRAYNSVFRPGRLSLGLVAPIEKYAAPSQPTMQQHLSRAQLAEQLGFSAIWLRDIPFTVPAFGDVGQIFDPFVYLGVLAGATQTIGLGVASVILPLRHPAHVAKAAATADVLSQGRLLLGVASGDRQAEYPAMSLRHETRGEQFRSAYDYIRSVADKEPTFDNGHGRVGDGLDVIPKPTGKSLPLLITGSSQQSGTWIAAHGDGWMVYPRDLDFQRQQIATYRRNVELAGLPDKPVMQPLYIDLVDGELAHGPQTLHLGLRLNMNQLRDHLESLQALGVNHVALNLRFNEAKTEATLQRIATELLPEFS